MKENYTICHCKQVTYFDIVDALHDLPRFEDVLAVFEDVKAVTHCSTGCGGCHDQVLDVISEVLMSHDRH
ncbi:MAG: (2Fe-2S)-binding protein [Ruminococcaceae bacterium]|nr:(2Fe-2S)-binding protein [Oscillospiraceae bacterium]